jgi:hypothetical protein
MSAGRTVIASAATLAIAFAPACGGDFEPGSRVTDLRVLAVRADAPYAAPRETVHLEALAVDPQERAITWGWGLCINPASPSAAGCLARLDASTIVIEKGKTTFDFTLPGDVIDALPAGAAGHASVGAVVAACPGDLAVGLGSIRFSCMDPLSGRTLTPSEYVVGVKRVFARATDKNDNPIIDRVTWDGVDWPRSEVKDVVPCDENANDYGACTTREQHVVAVAIPEASIESGLDSFRAPFQEQVIAQYYATEGIFEHDVRLASDTATGWTARRASARRMVTMWVVVRDDRGGVAWEERQIRVAER